MSTTASFDELIHRLDGSLVVVTAAAGDQRAGCVVGFHTQCSIEPARYALWLSKANLTYRVALFATHVGVHFLTGEDRPLFELFGGTSGDRTEKFDLCDWAPGPGGTPLLTACPTRVVLEIESRWDDGSDHVCVTGAPVDVDLGPPALPLRLAAAVLPAAGHAAGERPEPGDLTGDHETASHHPDAMGDDRRNELEQAAAGAGHAVEFKAGQPDEATAPLDPPN
jgi:flavin reductase (DIM6/NTAB) family NADH-FMN oxidoreductase RutF